ncbi:MAG: MFS transporter [Brevefilum sp.]|nr:MFS transporter [Brevefilum sp.]MDW7754367.1 MFS transporter [Brevefilum sp.]
MNETLKFAGKPYPHWQRRFFTIWSGQAISMLGSQIVSFAIVWYLTEQTGSATVLAIASMFGILPNILLSPFAGAMADRGDRKSIMIISDLIVGLARLLGFFLFLTGAIQVWHIYLMIFVGSAAGSFQHPAMASSTGLMVPKKHLSRVAGMNQTLQGALSIAGPPLGALLMSLTTIANIYMVDVITMLFAVLPLLFIPIPRLETRKDSNGDVIKQSFFQDIKEGFQYILNWKGLTLLLLSAMLINFLISPAMSLLPLLVSKHFGGNEVQLALMNSMLGIGMLIGGIILSIWGGFKRRIFTSFMGLIVSGLSLAVVGFIPSTGFSVAVFVFLISALMIPFINGPIHAVVQSAVTPEMQGRVISLIGTAAGFAMPIGLAIAGPVSDAIGIQTWFIIGGICMSLTGILGFMSPAMRHIEDQHQRSESIEALLTN